MHVITVEGVGNRRHGLHPIQVIYFAFYGSSIFFEFVRNITAVVLVVNFKNNFEGARKYLYVLPWVSTLVFFFPVLITFWKANLFLVYNNCQKKKKKISP